MKLAALELSAEQVIERGGIKSAIKKSRHRKDTSADALQRDLTAVEREISRTKKAYYDTLSSRKNLLAEIKRTDEMSTSRHSEGAETANREVRE